MVTITMRAQSQQKDVLIEKQNAPLELNQEALYDMQRSFRHFSYDMPLYLFSQQEHPLVIKKCNNFIFSTLLLSNTKTKFPTYEQAQIHFSRIQVWTNYEHSPYLMQKKLSFSFPLTNKISFYVNGEFDWGRKQPIYIPASIQPLSFGTGLSFKLNGEKTMDVGVKCQYTRGQKLSDVYKKWDSLMDCTLHF